MKRKRVVIYVDEEEYKKLRAKLILVGKSVSQWIREIIDKFLKE